MKIKRKIFRNFKLHLPVMSVEHLFHTSVKDKNT